MALKSLVDLSKEQFGTTVEFEFHVKEKFFLDPTGIMDQHEYGQYLEYADLKKVREVISLEENFYSLKSFFKILHEAKSKDRYKDEIAIFLVKTEKSASAAKSGRGTTCGALQDTGQRIKVPILSCICVSHMAGM